MQIPTSLPVFAIVLAAGAASRFGSTKQLQEYRGTPLVRRATQLAEELCNGNSVIVVGHDRHAVIAASQPCLGFVLVNDDFATGFGTSIATAVRAVQHAAGAVILLLADQPLITSEHLQTLRNTWSGAPNEIVVTAFADTMGPPVLFARDCFEDLQRLRGDEGARHILRDPRFVVKKLKFENAGVDLDTPEDLLDLLEPIS